MAGEFQAVLFDLDGTLLNTLDDLANSMNAVLTQFGFPEHPIDSYRYLIGQGVDYFIRHALPEDHLDNITINKSLAAL